MNTELQNPIVKWPFGKADVVSLTATGNQAVDIYNNLTIVDGASVIATGARTLNLAISKDVEPGARLVVKTRTTSTESLTPGEGMAGKATAGVAGKTKLPNMCMMVKNLSKRPMPYKSIRIWQK